MEAYDFTRKMIVLLVPVLIARLLVYFRHQERTHAVWTFGVPTVTLLAWALRVDVTQNLDLFGPDDWVTAASYAGLVLGQMIATFYQWAPPELFDQLRTRQRLK